MKTKNQENKNFGELIDESKEDIFDYIEKRLTLAKLRTYEKTANVASRIMYGVVIMLLSFILSILLVITAALFLGRLLNDYSVGFAIIFLAFIVVMMVIALNKRKVRRFFINMTLRTIKKIEKDED